MKTGRFKVFRELNDFWEEFSIYHRKDGKVVAERDDLLCAVRYALMMLRFARTETSRNSFNRAEIIYPPGYFQSLSHLALPQSELERISRVSKWEMGVHIHALSAGVHAPPARGNICWRNTHGYNPTRNT